MLAKVRQNNTKESRLIIFLSFFPLSKGLFTRKAKKKKKKKKERERERDRERGRETKGGVAEKARFFPCSWWK